MFSSSPLDQCSPIFFWIWKNPISGPFPINVWKMGQDLNLGNGMGNEKNLEIIYSSLFCSTISTVTCVSSVEQWKSLPAGGSESCRKMKLNKTVLSAVSFCQIKNGRLKWDGLGIVLQTGKWDISKPFRERDGKWAE